MEEKDIKTNSWQAWLLAARPKTLTGAAVPVMMGTVLAWHDLHVTGALRWGPFAVVALLCFLFAFLMQIDANLINDYYDFKKGVDDEHRLGPKRACAQGWITLEAMWRGIVCTTVAACLAGLPLVLFGGWQMVAVGLVCVLFCFLYTTHLSYIGMGDVLVLVFFGVVPVCVTYYLHCHTVSQEVFLASLACGLVIDTLLVVNNYRDLENDRRVGKRTLVVLLGASASRGLFFLLGLLACLLGGAFVFQGRWCTFFLPFVYLAAHALTYRKMRRIGQGAALNRVLGENARNMFAYGLLFTAGVLLDCWLLGC